MPSTLPVSRVVNVGVNLDPLGAQSQSLSDLLLLGLSTFLQPGESKTYSDYASVVADFGATAPEAKAASLWFAQSPQPTQLIIGRWVEGQVIQTITGYDDHLGQSWYALVMLTEGADASAAELAQAHIDAASAIEASSNKHIYGVTVQSSRTLAADPFDPASPGNPFADDIAARLQLLSLKRTLVQYSSTRPDAVVSALARILTTDYTQSNSVITLKFKQQPLVLVEFLSTSQANAVESRNCNVFVRYNNNTSIFEQGVMCNGMFVDEIIGTDWLAVTIQTALYNLLYASPTKIPQTDAGQQILTTAAEAICAQGVQNGLLAPGVWNSNGFGQLKQGDFLAKGYYLHSDSFNLQSVADRAARHSMPIQVAVKLAGAIHDTNISVSVNR